jgi:hypothetical protein
VTLYNVNTGHNEEIVKRSEHLFGYVTLLAKARTHEQSGLKRPIAVTKAIKECIDQGILAEYLRKNASEVSNMILQDWNWEDAKTVWQKEAEERGMKLGEKRGMKLGEKRGEERSDLKWKSVIADKEAQIAELQAQLEKRN